MAAERRLLTGWGRTSPSAATVVVATDADDAVKSASAASRRGVIARGLGRSYNDAAQNGGGVVVDVSGLDGFVSFDAATGVTRVDAGVSIGRLIEVGVPLGWFPPVTPGTRHVTVGGAIAADVHGKNHHRDGSIARFVDSIRLWTPADGVIDVGPAHLSDVFWATTGGMGLTGVILDATIRMRPVESSRMSVDVDRARDLDEVMALMTEGDDDYLYSVAWIDCQAAGAKLGRSVLTRGRHARVDELRAGQRDGARRVAPARAVPAPPWTPPGMVNRLTVGAFNELWFRKAPARARGLIQDHGWFFYPLDLVSGWNRMYGRDGFVQYQCVVPFGAEDALRGAIERLTRSHTASFLAVLKRFGAGTPGPMSFPTEGWTLALDFAVGPRQLTDLLDDLDVRITDAGGRCYLAKDGRARPELLPAWYPRIDEWRAVQRRLDPAGVLESDLARRLDLLGRGERT
ncbi:MAG: decaprenylphospho-beta-D-ribofuranose 2-oxidase [Actinomycetota bacterium]|nr:decaprenylphospho-beta-D-ribofuranose 2-oxidase [Actinomycetota bacterium]